MNGDPIPCKDVIIRLIGRKKHVLTDGEAATEAFILRPTDEGKLSFFRRSISDLHVCRSALSKIYGAATLHSGRIRSTVYPDGRQIDVVEAEGEGTDIPGHTAMIGLPDPETEPAQAERVASLLREQSRGISIA